MLSSDSFIALVMGGVFVVVGIALFVWGKIGERKYYDLSVGMDVTDYLEHGIEPWFESLKMGGAIAIAVGLFLLVIGSVLLLLG